MYYVINDNKCLFESMTKEQILAAITQAVSTHTISDVDTGFVTTLKEQNSGNGLKFWVGSTAEYNAIQNKEQNCFYILTDDTELDDLEAEITRLGNAIDSIAGLKGQVLLNQTVNYGDNLSVALDSDNPIENFSIVKVIAQGAGEILCTVQNGDENVTIKGCGFATISGLAGSVIININLTCNKNENKLTRNKSTATTISSSEAQFSEQSINKIVGVY